jgi:hypothetical protein
MVGMAQGSVKPWPIWKTLLLFVGTIGVGVPIIMAVQKATGTATTDAPRAEWREFHRGGMDGLMTTRNDIDLTIYCGDQSPIAFAIRSPRQPFSRDAAVLSPRQSGQLDVLAGWACLPDYRMCSTDGVDPSMASLWLYAAAEAGHTETLTFTMDDGSTRRIAYDFGNIRDRYARLVETCRGRGGSTVE